MLVFAEKILVVLKARDAESMACMLGEKTLVVFSGMLLSCALLCVFVKVVDPGRLKLRPMTLLVV